MRIKSIILLFVVSAISLSAQNARSILDKASDAYNKAGGLTASFTLDSKDAKAKNTYSSDGKISMKGDKFKIETVDGITWFDGTTQWAYIKDTEEVNISNPTGEELQGISPSALFSIYKKGFRLNYKGEKRIAGKSILEVEMTPEKKNSDFSKITVQIDKATNLFSSVTVNNKSGMQYTLNISKMQTGVNLADAVFSFNKREYPKADIVDLR